ncbi:MAG TPA: Ig-like domain-containing protein [bacterium]|nr:Ig-like domain-containing protein [bacterium]HOR57211.1 Ig-like domain-containing protein [bacterium]HPL56041.1 Ig-like domain-containing protein [bacterium]
MIRRFKKITAGIVLATFAMSTVILSLPSGAYAADELPEVVISQPTNGLYISDHGKLIVQGIASDDNAVTKVDLQMLNVDTGKYWSEAVSNWVDSETNHTIANPPMYWSIDLDPVIDNGHRYTLKAIATDNSSQANETSVSLVGDTEAPAIAVTSHADGDVINSTTLRGTATDVSGVSKVRIKKQGEATWSQANGTTNWSYDFTAPVADAEGKIYTFEIHAYDNAVGANIGLPIFLSLVKDSIAPPVGETIHPENNTVAFESTVVFAGVSEKDALMKLQINSEPYVAEQKADDAGNWRFEVPASELGAGIHTVALTATDKAGNANTRHMTFTVAEQVVAQVSKAKVSPSLPIYQPTLAVSTDHIGVSAPAPGVAEKKEEEKPVEEGNVETGAGEGEEDEASPWQTIVTVIAILVIAIGVGTVGYYGYEWWLSRNAMPVGATKKPEKREETTGTTNKAKSKKKGSRSRRSSSRW